MVNEMGKPHGDFRYSRWQLKQLEISPNQFSYESGNRHGKIFTLILDKCSLGLKSKHAFFYLTFESLS